MSNQQEWEVQRILQRGTFKNVTHYLILWKGFDLSEATWEPICNLMNSESAIAQFQTLVKSNKKTKKPRGSKKKLKVQNIFTSQAPKSMNFVKIQDEDIAQKVVQSHEINGKTNKQILQDTVQDKTLELKIPLNHVEPVKPTQDFLQSNKHHEENAQNESGLQYQSRSKRKRQFMLAEEDDLFEDKMSKKIKNEENTYYKPMQKLMTSNMMEKQIVQCIRQTQFGHQQVILNNQDQTLSKQKTFNFTQKPVVPQNEQQDHKNQTLMIEQTQKNILLPEKKACFNVENILQPQDKPQQNFKATIVHDQTIDMKKVVQNQTSSSSKINKKKPQRIQQNLEEVISTRNLNNFSRYKFLDELEKENLKIQLQNIMRKLKREPKCKIKVNIINLMKNPQLIQILDKLKTIHQEVQLQKIEYFIRLQYSWIVVGSNKEFGDLMADVNLMSEKSWSLGLEKVNRKI